MFSAPASFVSVRFMSAVVVIATIAALAAGHDCPSYNIDHDIYNVETLPYQCSEVIMSCPESLCLCLGGSGFNTTANKCDGDIVSGNDCVDVGVCMKLYTICVGVSYNYTNDTCAGGWWDFIQSSTVQMLTSPDTYNTTEMWDSCAGYSCKWANVSFPQCELDYQFVCEAPFLPPNNNTVPPVPIPTDPGATPIPTNSNGEFTVPVKALTVVAVFQGDFHSLFRSANPAAIAALFKAIGDAFSKYTGYNFKCTNATEGSLVATVVAYVPTSQPTVLTAVTQSVNRLNTDSSTTWYQAIVDVCQGATGCAGGVRPPTLKSVTVVDAPIGTPTPIAPVEQKCSSGCVAGIIIACIAVVVIITAVTCVIVRRSGDASTGTKEPATEMQSGNPMTV